MFATNECIYPFALKIISIYKRMNSWIMQKQSDLSLGTASNICKGRFCGVGRVEYKPISQKHPQN